MKITELLSEEQLDELSLTGMAKGIGGGVGNVRNAFSAAAQGYRDARQQYQAKNQTTATNTTATNTTGVTTQSNASSTTPPANTTPPATTAMKGSEIAGELKTVWDKATADQASMTSSPQVKQQIISMAKHAGMTGQTIESKFYSKFLNREI